MAAMTGCLLVTTTTGILAIITIGTRLTTITTRLTTITTRITTITATHTTTITIHLRTPVTIGTGNCGWN
jgi:hypothetical protein